MALPTIISQRSGLFYGKQRGGLPFIQDVQTRTGNVFFVMAGGVDSAGHGLHPDDPFATIDFAIGQCTANQGDVIYVMPGHSETVTGVGGITGDVAGVAIIGLGWGNTRPQVLMDGASTVTLAVSAADVWIENIIFLAGHADIATFCNLTAARLTLKDCDFIENTSAENFLLIVDTGTTNNEADGLALIGCRVIQPDTATVNVIKFDGDCDSVVIRDSFLSLGVNDSNAVFGVATGKDLTNIDCCYNRITRLNTAGDLLFDSDTTDNSGIVAFNVFFHADTSGEVIVDLTGVGVFENYGGAVVDKSGYLLPVADS